MKDVRRALATLSDHQDRVESRHRRQAQMEEAMLNLADRLGIDVNGL